MPPNGWCEPRPPAPAGVTRLNHCHLREQNMIVESARVGVGSTQGWAAFTQKLIPLLDQRQESAVYGIGDLDAVDAQLTGTRPIS